MTQPEMDNTGESSDCRSTGVSRFARSRMDAYYIPKLKKYGNSAQAVGWVSSDSQRARFKAACDIGCITGSSILDVGCGLGHFYGMLRENFNDFSYMGIDLSPSMVEHARTYFPDGTFRHRDILSFAPAQIFDYAVTIGPYNVEVNDNEEVMRNMITKMFRLTRQGIALSMTWGNSLPSVIHFFDAEAMAAFCRTLTEHVFLRKNHEIGDFMLYLYHGTDHRPPMTDTAGYGPPVRC